MMTLKLLVYLENLFHSNISVVNENVERPIMMSLSSAPVTNPSLMRKSFLISSYPLLLSSRTPEENLPNKLKQFKEDFIVYRYRNLGSTIIIGLFKHLSKTILTNSIAIIIFMVYDAYIANTSPESTSTVYYAYILNIIC